MWGRSRRKREEGRGGHQNTQHTERVGIVSSKFKFCCLCCSLCSCPVANDGEGKAISCHTWPAKVLPSPILVGILLERLFSCLGVPPELHAPGLGWGRHLYLPGVALSGCLLQPWLQPSSQNTLVPSWPLL